MAKILIVDDEENILELVRFNLEREGYQVLTTMDGNKAMEMARAEKPDLIVLDVMLPGLDGLEVCRLLHQEPDTRDIPIIMLSARSEEVDKIIGLELGADDYVTKPFSPRELLARIKARLRRVGTTLDNKAARQTITAAGELVIDPSKFLVTVGGQRQDLTPKEFELLRFLASHPGKVFTRDYLLEKIWGYDYVGDTRTVDVHIRHIRQKIEGNAPGNQYIETVRGVGYRFKEMEAGGEE